MKGDTGLIYIGIEIKNFGQTPADITNIVLRPIVISPHNAPLPAQPDYSGDGTLFPKAFLVSQDWFSIFHVFRIAKSEIDAIKIWDADLYVIGYVDYIDKFGARHRGGYARKYTYARDDRKAYASDDEFAQRSNLIFVTQDGYNYDRPRIRGEGDDWDQA